MMTRLRQSLRLVGREPAAGQFHDELPADQNCDRASAHQPPRTLETIGAAAADLALALTAAEWERIKDCNDVTRLLRFAAYFPGYYSELAYEQVHTLEGQYREDSNWLWAEEQGTAPAYLRYLAAWPGGRYVATAQSRLARLGLPVDRSINHQDRWGTIPSLTNPLHASTAHYSEVPQSRDQDGGGGVMHGLAFRDAPLAPELVAVAAGEFIMGADDDNGRQFEMPVRSVAIPRRLAVGRFPVTFEEWGHAVRAGAIAYQPDDEGWGIARRPVINVSWYDAKLYTAWLSQVTGFEYRLLTEAEWEYCCRAGSEEAYATGPLITPAQAQFSANEWGSAGKSSEVGSFEPNNFGIYDMHGNVSEWVEDDWVAPYGTAGCDGSAVKSNTSTAKITRGGGWPDLAGSLRSACRNRLSPKTRNNSTGFRIVRTLAGDGTTAAPREDGSALRPRL
jgi:formylglycine-generating enzyme required for sulfatase activity